MLCLAALMMLFMVGLLVYDMGEASRDKIDAQMSADVAAYSQSTIRARGMNTIAFANVGKRTVVSMHHMLTTNYLIYLGWWASRCSRCCCGWFCGCWGACLDCFANIAPIIRATMKWIKYNFGSGKREVKKTLEGFHDYQNKMKTFAGYWSSSEGIIRALRNGAHAAGTYPHPNTSAFKSELPVEFGNKRDTCPMWFGNPLTAGVGLEILGNWLELKRLSTSRPWGRKGPRQIVLPIINCLFDLAFLGDAKRSMRLSATGNSGSDLMKKSSIMFTYTYNEGLADQLDENYRFMEEQSFNRRTGFFGGYRSYGGTWGMARSEMIFPPSDRPRAPFSRINEKWLYHPSWIAKLRPMTLPGIQLPVTYKDMFNANITTSNGGSRVLYTSGILNGAGMGLFLDAMTVKKAFKSFDGTEQHGGGYIYDGLGK